MAEGIKNPNNKETKIPVFAVLKNGTVVKNIFLNNPQWVSVGEDRDCSDREECPVLIGRHPDCHVVVDHPSISRFHLDIRAEPASTVLSVTDLSSVHGTWVSGNKIQPNIPVELTEGDTLKLGASTRVYRLHWIPLSSAFEMEKPLPAVLEENEEIHQELISMETTNEVCPEEIPSAPPLPLESETHMTPVKKFNANEVQPETRVKSASSLLSRRSKSKSVSFLRVQTGRSEGKNGEASHDGERGKGEETFCRALFSELDSKEEEKHVSDKENMTPSNYTAQKFKRNEESTGVPEPKGHEENEGEIFVSDKENMTPLSSRAQKSRRNHVETQRTSNAFAVLSLQHVLNADNTISTPEDPSSLKRNKPMSDVFSKLDGNKEEEKYVSDKENITLSNYTAQKLKRNEKESTAVPEPQGNKEKDEEIFVSDKENMTPLSSSAQKSRRNHIETQRTSNAFAVLSLEHVLNADNTISTPEAPSSLKRNKPMSDICAMKENSLPEFSSGHKLKTSLEEEQQDLFHSDKENATPGVSRARKSKKLCLKSHNAKERVPFQSLLENSPSKNSSPLGYVRREVDKERAPFQSLTEKKSPLRNSSPVNYAHKLAVENEVSSILVQSQCMEQAIRSEEEKREVWNIVVDAGCLLNEESRKSLQLLEGLKGTHLIVPRIVIRELDCLRRREGCILFRKERRAASSALQWIEECMVKCSWWIHVQSSSETLPVPPTPPATPRPQLGDGKEELCTAASSSSTVFSTCGSLMEIVSPTAEDHILDCALLFKRIKDKEQFALLSDSITLKIKAMAEGLICESAKEFHASLVNPYSKRFLWTSSSPRGATWSCVDEVALIENYCHQFPAVGKLAKPTDDVKGLKLILLHNSSHYGKTNLIK